MKRTLCIAALLGCLTGTVWAGPNAGGVLVAVSDGVIYTGDVPDYCGSNPIVDCADGVVRADMQVADWNAVGQRPGADADRVDLGRMV